MRVAAYTLLFLMAFDLGMDFVYGESGDLSFSMPMPVTDRQAIQGVDLALNQIDAAPTQTTSSNTHECFCCCTHLVPGVSQIVDVEMTSSKELVPLSVTLLDPDPIHIYHPPLYS